MVGGRADAAPQQRTGDQLDEPPGRRVDHDRPARPADQLPQPREPRAVVLHALDGEAQIGSIE